jgi:predicted pyridoxine 5'-phosphate oxidase superfamily flavin-nucleotide-binding protein
MLTRCERLTAVHHHVTRFMLWGGSTLAGRALSLLTPEGVTPVLPTHPEQAHPGTAAERDLQCRYGTRQRAERFYGDQVLDHLNPPMREFVARQDMAFIATADAAGECDASFRAGGPGFIHVIDERTVAYPEYRGNGVMASLGNIHDNPHVGILMIDFVHDLIGLHLNGTARVVEDAALRAEVADLPAELVRGRQPERWVVVSVEEAFVHCRKHIPRMMPVPRRRSWGTDDARRKGGDFFGAAATPRSAADE